MPEPKRPLKVFLCHASADKPAVRDLYKRLTADGVNVWLDKENLLPGQDWEFEIQRAVRESDVVIVCLSQQFNQKGFRQKEVRLALDTAMEQPEGEIFIIPARLEECEPIPSLRKLHWVDLFEDTGYKKIMLALNEKAKRIEAEFNLQNEYIAFTKSDKFFVKEIVEELKKQEEKPSLLEKIISDIRKFAEQRSFKRLLGVFVLIGLGFGIIYGLPPLIRFETLEPTPTVTNTATLITFTPIPVSKTPLITITPTKLTTLTPVILLSESSQINSDCLYTVEPGDTLFGIAEKFGVGDWRELSCASDDISGCDILQPEKIAVDWRIIVPNVNEDVCILSRGQPQVFSQSSLPTEITDDFGVEMVLVPAGDFIWGDTSSRETFFIKAYYIDKYEVTNINYGKCVYTHNCQPPRQFNSNTHNDYYGNMAFDDYPVLYVDWNMADTYCKWRGGNLPDVFQWEKAARGTDGRIFPWGGYLIDQTFANYAESNTFDTVAVGTYENGKSPYNIYEMAGNVLEWTEDLQEGNPSETDRALRGGSWDTNDINLASYNEFAREPSTATNTIGFRCIREISP